MACPHYIFGYGSLICPISRAVTAPTLADRAATPVRVKHLERLWSFPVKQCGMTFMGIRVKPNAECAGVLVPVNDEELAQFDKRELGYDRVPVAHHHIERVPFLCDDELTEHYNHQHCYFFHKDQKQQQAPTIWVYVQQNPMPVNDQCPIAQTYLDVILRGCLSISREFAQDFLVTTRGWHPQDYDKDLLHQYNKDGRDHQKGGTWVNDRQKPLYVRADTEYSKSRGHELDRILEVFRPEMVHRRDHC